jgi:hypothetical protein
MYSLPENYSQKAVFLSNVEPNDSVYSPSPESRTQSRVFAAAPVNQNQTPIAFTQVGDGRVGYIGDVNNEAGSQAVILAMVEFAANRSTGNN